MIRLKEHTVRAKIAQTGHSIKSWAESNGFPQGTLSGWVTGRRNIKRDSLDKLAQALHCDPGEISEIVWEYDNTAGMLLESDREEICGIFGNLTKEQRKKIIEFADLIAEANRQLEMVETGELR